MHRTSPPDSPALEKPDAIDLQIREAAARLTVEWATNRAASPEQLAKTVAYFDYYLRTGETGAPK